ERVDRPGVVVAKQRDHPVIAQIRAQTGAQERGLADAGLAVEQAGAEALVGDQARELVALAIAAKEDVPLRLRETRQAAQWRDRARVGSVRHGSTIPDLPPALGTPGPE